MKRLEIQTLRRAGLSIEDAAQHVGVSPRSVQRVAQEAQITDPAAVDDAASRRMGRPSKVAPFEQRMERWLAEDPKIPTNHVLERLREVGYEGSKSAVYEAVRRLRKRVPEKGVARFEGVPGEFSQHDFGEVWVRYRDGSRERIKFFASCLKFSRMRRVMLVDDEKTESVCHGLVDAFTYFEGVPLISVFDNPKTIVTSRDGDRVKWNETFAQFCAEATIIPHATWPHRPQEKVPRTRHLLEKPRLRTLGVGPSGFRLRYTRVVRSDSFVEFDSIRYYAGERYIGMEATLHVDRDEVQIWAAGELLATHPRTPVDGKRSVLPAQREELISKPGARPYLKRDLLLGLCPAAAWCLTEIRHRRPDRWQAEVAQLYELLGEFDETALRDAFIEAGRRELAGAEYIEAILRGQAAAPKEAQS